MTDPIATTISILALTISSLTAWVTLFRRGTISMTQPTVIFFGPDAIRSPKMAGDPKVYIRTLLFSSSKQGRIVESMHVTLARNETRQNFNIWCTATTNLSEEVVYSSAKLAYLPITIFLRQKMGANFVS
jgi:hypothetical protein